MIDIIKPKHPNGPGWKRMPDPPVWVTLGYRGTAWLHKESGIYVISAVEVADDGDGVDKGPEYHISISKSNRSQETARCSYQEAIWVVYQFDMDGSEEDNHVPNGLVRNFWKPVADNLVGLECKCKDDEPAIKEDKGDFVWRGVTERKS